MIGQADKEKEGEESACALRDIPYQREEPDGSGGTTPSGGEEVSHNLAELRPNMLEKSLPGVGKMFSLYSSIHTSFVFLM